MPDIAGYLDRIAGHAQAIREQADRYLDALTRERARLAGIKAIRLPLITFTATNPFTQGGDTAMTPHMPESGFAWSVRHLVIEGLARGATPDAVQITRGGRIIWELNGNQYAQTWGRGEILLHGGEALGYQSVGTVTATGRIIIHGMAEQVPEEMSGKFFA